MFQVNFFFCCNTRLIEVIEEDYIKNKHFNGDYRHLDPTTRTNKGVLLACMCL